MSTPDKTDTKLFDGFPVTAKRDPRPGEALCSFKCGTIIDGRDDGAGGHCGMCCPRAVALRAARVKPLHEATVKAADEKVKKIKAAQAKAAKSAEASK